MKTYQQILLLVMLAFAGFGTCSAEDHRRETAKLYESMFSSGGPDIARLNLFFTRMPKGGDIHHHYTGSIYAETYLDWVEKEGWWIDPCTLKIVKKKAKGSCASLTVSELIADNTLYRKLLSSWSDMDYRDHFHNQPPPDSNFFNTFGYFGTVSDEYMGSGLHILKQRAIAENVSYIETMLTMVPVDAHDYYTPEKASGINQALRQAATQQETDKLLEGIVDTMRGSRDFALTVEQFVSRVDRLHQGMDNDAFTMRYQTYAARVLSPLQVFMNLYSGFMAAERSPLIVGVNIVAPENNTVSLNDYTLHMRMFNYLHRLYPQVNRALHAGELTLGMVEPHQLLFHITQAIDIAHAQRIGHGVDLPYEENSTQLLEKLKNSAAIEINLTSNQFILGVQGNSHPYLIYSAYGVPLVISTDDSGVSRNNLSNEYMLLASRYHPSYERIRGYVYNSIRYSFLAPDDKEAARRILDRKFADFEREMSRLEGHSEP